MIILRQKEFGLFSLFRKNNQSRTVKNFEQHQLKDFVPEEKKLIMDIEDIFNITGRGVVACGQVKKACVSQDNEIAIVHFDEKGKFVSAIKTKAVAIELFRTIKETAKPGENVGILLERTVDKHSIKRGDKIYKI